MKNFVLLFVISFLLSGCEDLTTSNTITIPQLEAQLRDIREFVNKSNCSGADECKYLPIGSKACGGPSGYIIFSNNIDVEVLKKMIEKYTKDQNTYNIENNVISDCSIPNPPATLGCEDGTCIEIR